MLWQQSYYETYIPLFLFQSTFPNNHQGRPRNDSCTSYPARYPPDCRGGPSHTEDRGTGVDERHAGYEPIVGGWNLTDVWITGEHGIARIMSGWKGDFLRFDNMALLVCICVIVHNCGVGMACSRLAWADVSCTLISSHTCMHTHALISHIHSSLSHTLTHTREQRHHRGSSIRLVGRPPALWPPSRPPPLAVPTRRHLQHIGTRMRDNPTLPIHSCSPYTKSSYLPHTRRSLSRSHSSLTLNLPHAHSPSYSHTRPHTHPHPRPQVKDSPFWSIRLWASRQLRVSSVTITAPREVYNNDGVDVDSSSQVVIEGLYYDGGDDAVALKSGLCEAGRAFATPTSNVRISNVVARTRDACFVSCNCVSGRIRHFCFIFFVLCCLCLEFQILIFCPKFWIFSSLPIPPPQHMNSAQGAKMPGGCTM